MKARARVVAGGRLTDAEALWYDPSRWATFIDGFGHLRSVEPGWPREGTVAWDSTPGGRGRVLERVVRYTAGDGQDLEVEDEKLTGTQSVRFAAAGEDRVAIQLELDYRLKRMFFGAQVVDWLFIRRAQRDSLFRTLRRFAIELAAERDL